jgi:uncharacterized metal-binding protein YceD (DUF177 family)
MKPNRPTTKPTDKVAGKLPWSVTVAVAEIPEGGKRFDLVADEATRAAVAKVAVLRSLPRLQATFEVARYGADGLQVEGEVSASVGQNCVVTLDPMDSEVKEEVDIVFAPPAKLPTTADDDDEDAAIISPDAPEPLTGDTIDLGALAVEFLILGVEPYPRKPGVAFEPPAVEEDDSAHPFAALAALKKGPDAKE